MAFTASPRSKAYAKSLIEGFPYAKQEAIAAGLFEASAAIPDRWDNQTQQRIVSTIIDGILDHIQNWPWDGRHYPEKRSYPIIAEAAYRWAKANDRTELTDIDWRRVMDFAERKIGPVHGGRFRFQYTSRGRPGRSESITKFSQAFMLVMDEVNRKLAEQQSRQHEYEQPPQPSEHTPINPNPFVEPEVEEPEVEEPEADEPEEIVIVEEPMPDGWRARAEWLNKFINNAHLYTADSRDPSSGESFDSVGMREFIQGAQQFSLGVPEKWLASNLIRNWPLPAKKAIWDCEPPRFLDGVYQPDSYLTKLDENPWNYDPTAFEPMTDIPTPVIPGAQYITDEHHKGARLILHYLHGSKLAWLIGPPGGGKTHLVGDIASLLEKERNEPFDYVVLSLTRATSPSTFYGKQRIDGTSIMIRYLEAQANEDADRMRELAERAEQEGDVTLSQFERICREGGVIGLDEADRADQNTMQLLNAPIAQRRFFNAVTQEYSDLDNDTMFMLMSNTEGTGATRAHGTAERMDSATINRFKLVRAFIELDVELANRKYWQILNENIA